MATNQISITLSDEALRIIESRVAAGEYATPSDVVQQALSLLEEETFGLEEWIETEGVQRYDAMKADPSRGLTSDELFASLDSQPQRLSKAG